MDPDHEQNFLSRTWPVALGLLTLVATVLAFALVHSATDDAHPRRTASAIALAILPNLAASLLTSLALYGLLRRELLGATETHRVVGDQFVEGSEVPNAALRELLIETLAEHEARMDMVAQVGAVQSTAFLMSREELPKIQDQTANATEVWIAAVSGLGLINHYRGLFERLLKKGVRFKVLLMDSDSRSAVEVWDRMSNPPMSTPSEDMRIALVQFEDLRRLGSNGQCEIRRLDTFLPFSLIGVNADSEGGTLQVEYHSFREAPGDRAAVFLTESNEWYSHLSFQFKTAWELADEYEKSRKDIF